MPRTKKDIKEELVDINQELEERAVRNKAQDLGLDYVDIAHMAIDNSLKHKFPVQEWVRDDILPFRIQDNLVELAIVDPGSTGVKRVLTQLRTQDWKPQISLATHRGIMAAYERLHGVKQFAKQEDFKNVVEEEKVGTTERELAILRSLKKHFRESSSAETLNTILVGGIRLHATDIHFEPYRDNVRLRFRFDGVLHEAFRLDHDEYDELSTQLKHKAGMKMNIKNIAQDGRFSFEVNDREIDVRVSVVPTEFGDGAVLRLLDPGHKMLEFDDLGIDAENKKILEKAIRKTSGMLVVTGPTGSGKSTTLYSILQKLNTSERKIITLEDPVEYHLDGIEQSQISPDTGYTFASGLRALLRHDPEVIMVGEIRDPETARIAMQASITGHLVLTTLHTTDTISTIIRFEQMEIEPYLIAPSLSTIIAQRLVRQVCPNCSTGKRKLTSEEKSILNSIRKAKGDFDIPSEVPDIKGCDQCSDTGYKGRIGIYEILSIDDEIRTAIIGEVNELGMRTQSISGPDLYKLAVKKGLRTIFADGISKVAQGITSIEELLRVLGE